MLKLNIGMRCLTKRGLGVVMAITPYQAQVRLDEGDDAPWLPHAQLEEAPPTEENEEPTVLEMLDSACAIIEIVRARIAAGERVV